MKYNPLDILVTFEEMVRAGGWDLVTKRLGDLETKKLLGNRINFSYSYNNTDQLYLPPADKPIPAIPAIEK